MSPMQMGLKIACSDAKVCANSDCGAWWMNTSNQRTSGKTVGHSFGGCGTSNTPDSALLYIFCAFIHHTSQRGWPKRLKGKRFSNRQYLLRRIRIYETYLNWHLLFFRTSDDTSYVDSTNVRPSTGLSKYPYTVHYVTEIKQQERDKICKGSDYEH
ncbi:hypothetical protein V1477_021118 [Vespula maculifrons]|uniref:Uncharacterized protein n=1 Tax=Vespula maculifrons TaxID=7453 RepID=A0ABD2AH76_VESMC